MIIVLLTTDSFQLKRIAAEGLISKYLHIYVYILME